MAKHRDTDVEKSALLKSKIFLTHALKLINAPLVVEERLELIARIIADYLSVDDVSIFMKEPDSDTLVLRVSVGLDPIAIGNVRVPIGKGITGLVAKTRKYIATKNIMKDPRNLYSAYAQDETYPSTLSFPIIMEKELIGTLNIRSKTERDFTESEAEELNKFTADIAGSIKNAQLYESLQYRAKLLELSISIASSISSSLDFTTILDEVAWEIANAFGIKGILIKIFDHDGNPIQTTSHGLKANFAQTYSTETIKSCMVSQEPRVSYLKKDKPFGDYADSPIWSICLPLIGQKRSLGAISLFDSDETLKNSQSLFFSIGVDVLVHIAGLAAMAVENALAHSELKRFSSEEKNKLDVIETLYSRMSAIFDSIDSGIIAVDENGIIIDFNDVARKSLGFTDETKGQLTIDTVTSYKPSLSTIISQDTELTNRVVSFQGPSGNFAAIVTMRSYKDISGEQRECVISFRPMEETIKLISRFTSQRPKYTFEDIIGHSTTLTETIRIAKLAAQTNSTVLIVGESGTGKELFSQAIHNDSPVADGPFIPVNCAAIPKDLIESELFGYAEGAFTGARKGGYIGKFEQATGGTLFLDEIGDMPLDTQVKLLRVLQEKVIQRVGAEHYIPISTRVIAATNRDLKQAIQNGDFREELYWRLNVLTIEIPPLRDRREDIPEFVHFFIRSFAESSNKTIKDVDPAFIRKLIEYSWKGNIRQLENTIEHAVLVTQSDILTVADLPADLINSIEDEKSEGVPGGKIEQALFDRMDSSRKLYSEALKLAKGDVNRAAKNLGMSRATFYRRLKKYGLTDLLSSIRRDNR